jgi:hypothetical protein
MKLACLLVWIWALATLAGCSDDEGAADAGADGGDTDTVPGPYANLFDEVWQILQDEYPYMDYKTINWHTLRDQCRPLVAGPDATYDIWINEAMDCLLSPLADYHVNIFDLNDEWHTYGTTGWYGNFDNELADTYLVDGGLAVGATGDVTFGTTTEGGFDYVRTDTWSPANLAGVEFGELVDTIGDVPGYVLDVRANSGGSELEAMELAGLFVADTETPYSFFQERVEVDEDEYTHELTSPVPKTIWPEYIADSQYAGPVALLLGHKCMSSCELSVAMLTLSDQVETFGATTRGSSGNPEEKDLSNGTVLRHSTWLLTLADGETVLEWTGIEPEQPVEFVGSSADEVLQAAIDWLLTQ